MTDLVPMWGCLRGGIVRPLQEADRLGASGRGKAKWPTAVARDANGPQQGPFAEGSPSLSAAVLWATPSAQAGKSGRVSDDCFESNSRPLQEQVYQARGAGAATLLSPVWVAWLMGFPIDWLGPMPASGLEAPERAQQLGFGL